MTLTDAYPVAVVVAGGQGLRVGAKATDRRRGREGRTGKGRPLRRHFRRRASAVLATPSRVSRTFVYEMTTRNRLRSPIQETGGRRARAVSPMLSPPSPSPSPWWSDDVVRRSSVSLGRNVSREGETDGYVTSRPSVPFLLCKTESPSFPALF